ncbi:MAG: prepilin peptidase [Candidatus Hydrogenedentes bacterium]|nr:prepilin peptidase [Candidatus Hydrogenedentota bacterium]
MPLPEALQPLHPFFMVVSFILGTLVGSFCNVCASRWPAGESVVSPRSRCPKCKNPIAWYDNIPLFSWLFLGAKCRHCGLPISWQYPVVEAITGVLFFLTYWRFGLSIATPIYMLFCAAMVIVTFQDLADWTIPNEITFPGIPLGLLVALIGMFVPGSGLRVTATFGAPIFDALAGVVLGGGILYLLDRITVLLLKKPGMGFGDVKLLAMTGAFLGWKGVLGALMIGSVAGSVIGVAMILYFRRKGGEAEGGKETSEPATAGGMAPASPTEAKSASKAPVQDEEDEVITLEGHYLPFGPYLALGSLIYLFWGPEFLAAYIASLQGGG